MNKVYTISHEHQQQSKVALNGQHYADVFDDRWKSGYFDPRTWQVRFNQGEHTLAQIGFLWGTQEVQLTSNNLRESIMSKQGLIKKHFGFKWNGHEYRWIKRGSNGYTLQMNGSISQDVAIRQDTGNSEGVTSSIEILILPDEKRNPGGIEDEVILASGFSIGSATVDGGVLTSRPPTGIWMATTGRIAASSLGGSQMPVVQQW